MFKKESGKSVVRSPDRSNGQKIDFDKLERDRSSDLFESLLSMLVLGFLFFYIVFGIEDPIEIYDKIVWLIQKYSKLCHWVTEIWDKLGDSSTSMFDSNGILMWIISKLLGKEITFSDVINGVLDWFK